MAKVNRKILIWARKQAGLSVPDAAQLLGIRDTKTASAEEKLNAYEQGKELSRSMLKGMGRVYRRPILTFYLESPPLKTKRGEDFRTLPNNLDPQQNFHVDVLITDVTARQSIIREALLEEDDTEKLSFIGKYNMEGGIAPIVRVIREIFNIDLDEYRSQQNYDYAFKYLRQQLETRGIFVLLKGNLGSYHTDIALNVFRGFTLCDDIAPLIVINHQESKSSRAFTLLHELTHLLLGQTGVSSSLGNKRVEKFCDNIASELLLPAEEFGEFGFGDYEFQTIQDDIALYAQDRRISSLQVAFRCLDRGLIEAATYKNLEDYYREKMLRIRAREKERNSLKKGGPNQNVIRRNYLGGLVDFAQRMSMTGTLSTTKAAIILGVKPLKVQNLFVDAAVT